MKRYKRPAPNITISKETALHLGVGAIAGHFATKNPDVMLSICRVFLDFLKNKTEIMKEENKMDMAQHLSSIMSTEDLTFIHRALCVYEGEFSHQFSEEEQARINRIFLWFKKREEKIQNSGVKV